MWPASQSLRAATHPPDPAPTTIHFTQVLAPSPSGGRARWAASLYRTSSTGLVSRCRRDEIRQRRVQCVQGEPAGRGEVERGAKHRIDDSPVTDNTRRVGPGRCCRRRRIAARTRCMERRGRLAAGEDVRLRDRPTSPAFRNARRSRRTSCRRSPVPDRARRSSGHCSITSTPTASRMISAVSTARANALDTNASTASSPVSSRRRASRRD